MRKKLELTASKEETRGKAKNANKGFGSDHELAKAAASVGGRTSRRGLAFKSHCVEVLKTFNKWAVEDEWATMFWAFKPEFDYTFDEFGNKEMTIMNLFNILDAVAEEIVDNYLDDYEEKAGLQVSQKLYMKLLHVVKSYIEEKLPEIREQLLDDQKDYLDTIADWEDDCSRAIGAK